MNKPVGLAPADSVTCSYSAYCYIAIEKFILRRNIDYVSWFLSVFKKTLKLFPIPGLPLHASHAATKNK